MRRVIDYSRNDNQIGEKIDESWDEMLFTKEQTASKVHVILRPPEIIDGDHDPRGYGL